MSLSRLFFPYCHLLVLALLPLPALADDAMDGATVYTRYCAPCHDVGTAQAPLLSDTVYWADLLAQAGSTSALTNVVIEGKGAMPPMGGCGVCNQDQVRLAVEYMMPGNRGDAAPPDFDKVLRAVRLPAGFSIALYAKGLPGARQLALGDDGVVYVGSRGQGNVYALQPDETGTKAQSVHVLLRELNEPNGVAYVDGTLYVAEIERIRRIKDPGISLAEDQDVEVVYDRFPPRRWHGYKVLEFSDDGWLYTAVGMPCNTCDYREEEPIFGTLVRLRPDGKDLQVYARGVRNSVGMDWHPGTGELWFTDNGQDMMGDDAPPDELNLAPKPGMDFGFPYVYGNNSPSPGYTAADIPDGLTPAAYDLQAHVAPLGMAFYRGDRFPAEYHQQMLFAEHGSWNRSGKVGYKLSLARVDGGKVTAVEDFATGWLDGENTLGRPVDVLNLPDGSILVSDDLLGVVYRIDYTAPAAVTVSARPGAP